MPSYEFRCQECDNRFTLFYKSYGAYDEATPICPNCDSEKLSRLITSVAIPKTSHNYNKMSSNEMLSVLESGDSKQVDELYSQVGGASPQQAVPYHQQAKELTDKKHKKSDS